MRATWTVLGVLMVAGQARCAGLTPLALYKLDAGANGSQITYASGPSILSDLSGNGNDLAREGTVQFFASAPRGRSRKGSLLFKDGLYSRNAPFVSTSGALLIEAYASASKTNDPGLHAIVANGDGAVGYLLGQQDDAWTLLVGGVGFYHIAPVEKDQWVHLAVATEAEAVSFYLNGRRRGTAPLTPGELRPAFSIGGTRNKEPFNGLINEVRVSSFTPGKLDVINDLCLDDEHKHAIQADAARERRRREKSLDQLTREGFGRTVVDAINVRRADSDWLVHPVTQPVSLQVQPDRKTSTAKMTLSNGLVSRSFYVSENLACIGFRNLGNGAECLRAVKPEARIQVDGTWYDVGGLTGQSEKAYLFEAWLPAMRSRPGAFLFAGLSTTAPDARYPWRPRYHAVESDWPPRGLHVIMHYEAPGGAPESLANVSVDVQYEMYEGLPVVVKWLTVNNAGGHTVVIDAFESEHMAFTQDQKARLHIESDYAFALADRRPQDGVGLHLAAGAETKAWAAGGGTTRWRVDPEYDTWATQNATEELFMGQQFRCLLISTAPFGPGVHVKPNDTFTSFRTFELLNDSDDRERSTLGQRRMYRKLAPQVTESLLKASITSHDGATLKRFIDQMHELGFEALVVDPWPGISHDNLDPGYVAHWKDVAGYAKSKGIIMGAYELVIASRGRGADVDCIHPETGKPGSLFGQSVCVASKWSDSYFPNTLEFFDRTGFKMWCADGPYHGDPCASTVHAHHAGLQDSQWQQWTIQVHVLRQLLARDVYLPLPDWYFMNGSSSTGMGYREAAANLTPQQQLLLGRQYIYDGTWHKCPTMGWMGLQLVGFYTNDPRVGLEPLHENIERYERGLFQHLGAGCQFGVRGNRLYDTTDVKAMVTKWVTWFKTYRDILTSDIIHLGRPTGRNIDCILHVNSQLTNKGMAIVFNPTGRRIKQALTLPLYYTGLTDTAVIREQGGAKMTYHLDREFSTDVPVDLEANGYTWLLITAE